MIDSTIKRIEKTITETEAIDGKRKEELLNLVSSLRQEIGSLDESHREHAGSIVSYAETSVREATRNEPDDEMLKHSLDGLSLSVRRFEVSHPTLIGVINNIGQVLGNIGI
jgi:hypothetical protein